MVKTKRQRALYSDFQCVVFTSVTAFRCLMQMNQKFLKSYTRTNTIAFICVVFFFALLPSNIVVVYILFVFWEIIRHSLCYSFLIHIWFEFLLDFFAWWYWWAKFSALRSQQIVSLSLSISLLKERTMNYAHIRINSTALSLSISQSRSLLKCTQYI